MFQLLSLLPSLSAGCHSTGVSFYLNIFFVLYSKLQWWQPASDVCGGDSVRRVDPAPPAGDQCPPPPPQLYKHLPRPSMSSSWSLGSSTTSTPYSTLSCTQSCQRGFGEVSTTSGAPASFSRWDRWTPFSDALIIPLFLQVVRNSEDSSQRLQEFNMLNVAKNEPR